MSNPLTLRIPTAEVFAPLLEPARYKGAHGGRGSAKSHFFAGLAVEDCLRFPGDNAGVGMRLVCIREVQKSLAQSAKRLIEDKLAAHKLGEAQGFKVYKDVISTPGDGLILFNGMQDHTADSIKSLEGFNRAWCEEGQSMSDRSLSLLRPTIRAPDSELWFSWNPMRPSDPVDMMLRGSTQPTGAVVVQSNWRDNPWFPKVLEQERLDCLSQQPERYNHIWEGGYATVLEGAYFAEHLNRAQLERRIGFFSRDPLIKVYAFWDIGGTGKRSDSTAIWLVQYIADEVRVLNYYEAVGQPFDSHVAWLRKHDYDNAVCVLPHDGATHDKVHRITPESYLRQAGFVVDTVPNAGAGAAMARIEAVRQMFPAVRFNEDTTEAGRDALGWYHEKRDPHRNVGLGPEHDWACLPAGTLINTPDGPKAVDAFTVGDEVVTAGKVGRVVRAQYVKDSPILAIQLADGTEVRCSPEHKVFTQLGLVMAKDLTYTHALVQQEGVAPWSASSSGIQKAFTEHFKVSGTTTGRSDSFTPASATGGRLSCIARCGRFVSGLSRKRTLWCLSLVIGSASTWPSGSVGPARTTALPSTRYTRASTLLAGRTTKHQAARTTTTHTRTPARAERRCFTGISTSGITALYLRVMKFTILTLTRQTTTAPTFAPSALKNIAGFTALPAEAVYDIEVELDHAYTLHESNVVVSNSHGSDAFGLVALYRSRVKSQDRWGKGAIKRNLKGLA